MILYHLLLSFTYYFARVEGNLKAVLQTYEIIKLIHVYYILRKERYVVLTFNGLLHRYLIFLDNFELFGAALYCNFFPKVKIQSAFH